MAAKYRAQVDGDFAAFRVQHELPLVELAGTFQHAVVQTRLLDDELVVGREVLDDLFRSHGVERAAHPRLGRGAELLEVTLAAGLLTDVFHCGIQVQKANPGLFHGRSFLDGRTAGDEDKEQ